jgi:hypothetical protein
MIPYFRFCHHRGLGSLRDCSLYLNHTSLSLRNKYFVGLNHRKEEGQRVLLCGQSPQGNAVTWEAICFSITCKTKKEKESAMVWKGDPGEHTLEHCRFPQDPENRFGSTVGRST